MWIVIKVVDGSIIGCAVGPFESESAAQHYADFAIVGSLGYEKWLIRELQTPGMPIKFSQQPTSPQGNTKMDSVLKNWKTSVAGLVLIMVGVLGSVFGVHIPGFTMDAGAALTAGIGLLLAKDSGPIVQ